jgi:hypothetical protein
MDMDAEELEQEIKDFGYEDYLDTFLGIYLDDYDHLKTIQDKINYLITEQSLGTEEILNEIESLYYAYADTSDPGSKEI